MLTFVSFKLFYTKSSPPHAHPPSHMEGFLYNIKNLPKVICEISEVHAVFTMSAFCADLSIGFRYNDILFT